MAAQRSMLIVPLRVAVQLGVFLLMYTLNVSTCTESNIYVARPKECDRTDAVRWWALVGGAAAVTVLAALCRLLPIAPSLRLPHSLPAAATGCWRRAPLRWLAGAGRALGSGWPRSFRAMVAKDVIDAFMAMLDTVQLVSIALRFEWGALNCGVFALHTALLTLAFAASVAAPDVPGTLTTATVALILMPTLPLLPLLLHGSLVRQVYMIIALSLTLVKDTAAALLKLRLFPSRWKYVRASVEAQVLLCPHHAACSGPPPPPPPCTSPIA